MRLNGVDNEPLGIVSLAEAFRLAEEANVDLVEIAPNAIPPVCRLMDYGKFKYSEQKKQHEAKLKQKIIQVKEIKFRPGTDEGDYSIKLRNLIKFLEEGADSVSLSLMVLRLCCLLSSLTLNTVLSLLPSTTPLGTLVRLWLHGSLSELSTSTTTGPGESLRSCKLSLLCSSLSSSGSFLSHQDS